MELEVKSHIIDNQIFRKTSEIFAKQSILTEEDFEDHWLDKVNEAKRDLEILYLEFDPFLDNVVAEISQYIDKQGLIVRNEYLNNLKRTVRKLIQTIEKTPRTRSSFRSDRQKIEIFLHDLQEITSDVDRRISPNAEIDSLLDKLADF